MAWRDSRSQRLRLGIFALSVVSGIAALVAIHSLEASVRAGIDTQAKSLLGSDLQVSARRAFTDDEFARLAGLAPRASRETSFSSMLYFPGADAARLVQVRGIEGGYPFYGKVVTTPADAWQRLSAEPGILLEPALLDQFGAKVGDRVKLGAIELPILGVVDKPAPRSSRFGGFAPEAYVRLAEVARSGLLGTNSMSSHQVDLALADGADPRALKERVRVEFPDNSWRLETPDDRRENLGDALENLQRFLAILALASLVLGAIGVAGAVHSHIARRVPTVAILRCLGCPAHLASAVYVAQAAALGLGGALLGAALGVGLQTGVLVAFKDSLPLELAPSPEWRVVARTAAAGFAVCCGFALVPLLKVRRISPAATLRGGVGIEGGLWRALPVYLLLGGLLVLLALGGDPEWKRALAMVGGLALAFALLAAVACGLMTLTRRIVRPGWPYLLRQGLSNLHRPGNQTLLFLLSLGLGSFLLVTVLLAGRLLQGKLDVSRTAESPNLYLVDVQPDQVDGVRAVLAGEGLPMLESAPMVTMRILAVRGVPVREAPGVPRWVARREFRSTYRDVLTSTETLVAGEWRSDFDPAGPVPLSLEEEIAKDMGVGIGDAITLDVQGVPVEARVGSLRRVDWSRFNLNFFMVFPPGVLEGAPGFHVVTTRTPDSGASGRLQRALVRDFANVSAIDLTLILESVRDILGRISSVVSVLAGFTVLAGLPILVGTLLNGRDVRLKESVLLRTLGASARQVRIILTLEYAALGLLSALTGVLLAVAANAALAVFVFEVSPWPDFGLLGIAFVSATGLAIAGGLLLGRGVCGHPPLEILRGAG
jgi:putative ABC transport system permease protein